jgi:16S rRNA (adenine1518-N6/adenine1519-N6)-dimethyltransferase
VRRLVVLAGQGLVLTPTSAGSGGPAAPLLGPNEVRTLAASLGVRPTKTLGQNFVHDQNTVRRIVRVAALEPDAVVLEIGPGLGSLTLGLLETGARVQAVEIDPVLAGALPGTVTAHQPDSIDRLRVITADALTLTPGVDPQPTALVANLPYNVAVPILLRTLDLWPTLRTGLVMVQTEVAHRLAAGPGSKVYGIPSVKLAWYAEATLAGAVGRAVFWPVPNVDSALLRFTRREPPLLPDGLARTDVFAVVDAAFAQRRKTLRAALSGWAGSAAAAETALRSAGLDPSRRGETLSLAEYVRLAAARA